MTKRQKKYTHIAKIKPKDGSSGWAIVGFGYPTKSGNGIRWSFLDNFYWSPEMKHTHTYFSGAVYDE